MISDRSEIVGMGMKCLGSASFIASLGVVGYGFYESGYSPVFGNLLVIGSGLSAIASMGIYDVGTEVVKIAKERKVEYNSKLSQIMDILGSVNRSN